MTAFIVPQFSLLPDIKARPYANVDNRVCFVRADGRETQHALAVPSKLFTIMQEVFKVPPEAAVTLYLLEEIPAPGKASYVFGMAWGEKDIADLWRYGEKSLPGMFTA